jgi:hypothetical protein
MKLTKPFGIGLFKLGLRTFQLVVQCFKKNPKIGLNWGICKETFIYLNYLDKCSMNKCDGELLEMIS